MRETESHPLYTISPTLQPAACLYICPTCNSSLRARLDFVSATCCLGPLALLQLKLPCSTAVHTVYFLSSILHLARATAVYIYIILKLPQLSRYFLLPGHRNFVLVHLYSRAPPISCITPYSRAPLILVHHSVISCTTRAPLHNLVHLSFTTRAPLRTLVHHSYSCTTT